MSFPQQKQHPLVCICFKIIKQTVRENSTRQEAVAFGQNQNIICDSVPCQGCVVWTVIAGNIVIGKGLRSVKPETCILKSFILFFLRTQVLLITFSFGGVYGIYCFLPVCAGTQVTALVFVKILKSSPKTTCFRLSHNMFLIKRNNFFKLLNNWNKYVMRCHNYIGHSFSNTDTLSLILYFEVWASKAFAPFPVLIKLTFRSSKKKNFLNMLPTF